VNQNIFIFPSLNISTSLLLNVIIIKIRMCSFVSWACLAGVAYSPFGAASGGDEA
jgi:hypothetical protein